MTAQQIISSEELDKKFDDGEDIMPYLDFDRAEVVDNPPLDRRVTLTIPDWMLKELDATAANLAISRNAIINVILADWLQPRGRRAGAVTPTRA